MKKYAAVMLMLGLAGAMLSGCKKSEGDTASTPTPTPAQETRAEETPAPQVLEAEDPEPTEEPIPDGYVTSYLTGEYVPETIGRRRPVAVMINNVPEACPQAGVANAGVMYEAPVEGGITRMMAIFEDYDNLEKIGPVRSCRDYFIFYASGFDSIYTHYGQSAYAVPYLELPEVDNLSGLAGYGDQVFYRTSDRPSPHNAYTSFEGLQKGIEINEYSQEYAEDFVPGYAFCGVDEEIDLPGTDAQIVKPGYFLNEPWFEYNPEDKLYYRYQFGEAQTDELTGEQLAYKNIIFQYSSWRKYDENGYLNIDVDAGNAGKYIVNGKAIDITWKKQTPWGPTYYYDSNGNQITLDTGKTWVCIIQDSYIDRVEILGADAAGTEASGESGEVSSESQDAAAE